MDGAGHSTIREGIIAGVLSATVIAVWLLIVDAINGHPFFTPFILGRGLLGVLGMPRPSDTEMLYVAAYTVFHYVTFAVVGIIVAYIVHQATRSPAILAGFFILFVIFEVGFYALAGMLSVNSELGGLAWYQIGLANLLATVVMAIFFWVRHPDLKREFAEALDGRPA